MTLISQAMQNHLRKTIFFWFSFVVFLGGCGEVVEETDEGTSIVSVPSSFTATSGNGQNTLDWDVVNGATSYTLYWGTTSGISSSSTTITSVSTDNYTHSSLTNGTTYYYKVAAVDASGTSSLSSEVSSTPSTSVSTTTTSNSLSSSIISELQSNLTSTSTGRFSISRFFSTLFSPRSTQKSYSHALTNVQVSAVVDAATLAVSNAGLSDSVDLIQLMPKIITGAQGKLASLGISGSAKIKVISSIVNSLVKSLNGRNGNLAATSVAVNSTAFETAIASISATSVANLDEAGITADDIATASGEISGTVIASLGDGGATSAELEGLLCSIASGSTGALDEISGFDSGKLGGAVEQITASVTGALDEISVSGFTANDLSTMIEKFTSCETGALSEIVMDGYDVDDISDLVGKISSGATAGLEKISMVGYSASNMKEKLAAKILAGTTSGLTILQARIPNPVIISVNSSTADGAFALNKVLKLQIRFNRPLQVDTTKGKPSLTLETGTTDRVAVFSGQSDSHILNFIYTVGNGDLSSDLDYVSIHSLKRNGGLMHSSTKKRALLLLPAPGTKGSLGANKAFVVDGTPPVLVAVSVMAALGKNNTPKYSFSTSEGGSLSYSGSCSSSRSNASSGHNEVTFNTIPDGTHSDCKITVTDAVGNTGSLVLAIFKIDTTPPLLATTTPVDNRTIDNTPDYIFNSNESGSIVIANGCASGVTTASTGSNTITLSPLADGTYSTCTITVSDAAGNTRIHTIPAFTVDTTPPVLTQVTAVAAFTTNKTPDYIFSSNESGTITYSGSCSSPKTSAVSGNNSLTLNTLGEGEHNNCKITLTDTVGNASTLSIPDFTVDFSAAVLNVVTAIPSPRKDKTPDFTFSSSESGKLTYSGSCSSITTDAIAGNNSVTFNSLADGSYNNCKITLTDPTGNAKTLNIPAFTVDTTPPVLAKVTAVLTLGKDKTPDYKYSSNESGTITYSGACSSSKTTVASGNNSLTFNSLADGTHSNCVITVTDIAGNVKTLNVASFTVDTTPPVLTQITAISNLTKDNTPSYTFSSNEAGTLSYSGSCSSSTTIASASNNTITFNTLSDGTHSACKVTITDNAGNQRVLNVSAFTVDTTAPVLAQVTSVASFTKDNTPSYIFSSNEAGTLSYSGSCSSSTTSASASNNSITFNTLSDGTHSACKVTVTDTAGNAKNLSVSTFTVDTAAPASPSLVLNGGTSSTNMQNITIVVSANDSGKVALYCALEASSATAPASNDACWKSAANAASFSQSVSNFALSSGFNAKTVRAWFKDQAGNVSATSASITRVNPNRTPVLAAASFTLLENAVANQLLGQLQGTDPDGDTLTYSIASGNIGNAFQLNASTGKLTVATPSAVDYETRQSFNLSVTVSDGKLSVTQDVVVEVLDQPETDGEFALSFDGSNDYVSIADDGSLTSTSALTISAWFKKVSGSGWMSLVGKGTSDANEEYVLMLKDDQVYFDVGQEGGPYLQQSTTIVPETWHHIAAVHTRSGSTSTLKVYLNGEDVGGTTVGASNTPNDNSHPLTIGSRFSTSNALFKGQIDEVRIWNKALTQQEIRERMGKTIDATDTLWDKLADYYRMDWGKEIIAYDYSQNSNHGTLTNGPTWVEAYSWERGMVAHLPLDGSGRDIVGTHSGILNGATPTTNPHGYAQKALDFDGSDDHVVIDEAPEFETNRHTVSVWVKSDTLASGDLVSKDNEIERQWLLEAVQGGKVRSVVWTSNIMNLRDSNKSLTQGQWHHLVRTWDGSAMSLYIDGILDHTVDTTGDALAAGTQPVRIGGNPNHFDGSLDEFRFYDRSLHGSEVSSLHAFESTDRFESGLVAYYPFNENANDESDSSNDGTVSGATLTEDRFGNSNQAYEFDGNDDYIQLSQTLPIGSTDNTITMWVKVPEVGRGINSGERVGILIGNYPSSPNSNWEINQGEVRIWWKNGEIDARGTKDLKDNNWHHLAFIRDTKQNKFLVFIDGNLELTENTVGSDIVFGTLHRIGGDNRDSSGGPNFHGQMDDIRIYNQALSESEIEELYDLERVKKLPEQLPGIALWLDASNIDGKQNTTLTNGSNISEWKDLSGNGNDALGTSFSDLPTIQDSGSQSLVDFDSSQKQSLALADATKLNFGPNEDFAYVIVLKTETVADTTEAGVLSNRTGTGGYAGYQLYINKSTGKAYSYLAQTDSLETVASNPVNDGKFKIIMSTYDRDSINTMYLNGLEVGSTSISNIINSDTDYPLEIGHEFFTSYVSKFYFDGEIAEILFFDQTLTENRSQIFAYLAEKWGLTETIDSDGDGASDALEIEKGSDPRDPADTPYQALPAADAVQAQYQGSGPFTLSGSNIVQWNDVSGNNRHITTYRGTPYQTSVDKTQFGLAGSGNIKVVQGDENSGFALPFALTSGSYTIAYLARYVGDEWNTDYNKRIFDARSGTGQNTMWGFHAGYAGRSHNGEKGWLTDTDYKMSDPDTWMIGVETEVSARFNGKDFTNKYLHYNGNDYPLRPSSGFNPTLSINYGHYTGQSSSSEISRWQVAELIIWNRELSEEEQKQAEEHLAQRYAHSSFKSVISNVIAYQSQALTGTVDGDGVGRAYYDGWYNIYDGEQWGYGDNNWHGPGFGKFVELNDKWYWGRAFTNGSQAGHVSYSNRNGANNTYKWTSPSMSNGTYKLHIISNGGGGGGGRANGGGGGAGGVAFFYNRDNLDETEFELEIGARGSGGYLWSSNQNGPGGDSTVRWEENGVSKSMSGLGGPEGLDSSSSSVSGGSYIIGDGDGGGPGGASSYSSYYGKKGGKPYEPQTMVGGQNSLSDIAKALGVSYQEGYYWWGSHYVWGNGGSGSRYGVGMDGVPRNGYYGGYGYIMVIMDSNPD